MAQGLGIRLFAFGGAYWPLATAHSDPLWARTCFGGVGWGGGGRGQTKFVAPKLASNFGPREQFHFFPGEQVSDMGGWGFARIPKWPDLGGQGTFSDGLFSNPPPPSLVECRCFAFECGQLHSQALWLLAWRSPAPICCHQFQSTEMTPRSSQPLYTSSLPSPHTYTLSVSLTQTHTRARTHNRAALSAAARHVSGGTPSHCRRYCACLRWGYPHAAVVHPWTPCL